MNVHEYQAALLLSRHGVPVNAGEIASTPEKAEAIAERFGGTVAVKAQVHTGGRGKAGGIKLAHSPAEARAVAEQILGMDIRGRTVHKVLVVPGVAIAQEFYLGVVLDRPKRRVSVMASAEGGVDIEEVARERPEKIVRTVVDPFLGFQAFEARAMAFELGIAADKVAGFAAIGQKLFETYVKEDATLVEINPLVLTEGGEWLALDAKMSFDDNALARHPGIEDLRDLDEENATELEARRSGISFVKLDGNIGCIVNGAGLAMATMDAVKLHGGDPANFLDVGGGANAEQVAKAFSLVTADPNVRAILINIFGGITRGDVVANGIREALGQVDVKAPIVVRLAGTNAEEGRRLLAEAGLQAVDTMDEAARQVVAAAR
ncbi:MAG: succinyl-CoA synthetase beta subunit [Thermomicrobiales bacterium]|jgi:succinyl-CoA synthetase beta subunit|nr:succinyl-CoA synthetase beta subunit [Thermomicrobiales bacterium]MEA2584424.1 succinyl-CoA synthetase beta subunit [Thermomicrobiales bacterium]MEA2598183.1 succinyl-CoA synthetase beta subunit [Thermomicrobiales bacterium]